MADESDDEYVELNSDEDDIIILDISKEAECIDEGDFVVTEFAVGSGRVYYVAKVIEHSADSYVVNCLRRVPESTKFNFLDKADISSVTKEQLRFKLPRPTSCGQTRRQQSSLLFNIMVPGDIELR